MCLIEYSVTFGYVVAVDRRSVMVYAPKNSDVVQRLLSHWVMLGGDKIVIYLTDPEQAKGLTKTEDVCRAIEVVRLHS